MVRVSTEHNVALRTDSLFFSLLSEFNYRRDENGQCVLVDGATPLPSDDTCAWDQDFWFDRTSMRKIPYSSCEGGLSLDKGRQHICPAAKRHGFLWWTTAIVTPFMFAGLIACWWLRRRAGAGALGGRRRGGRIRLDTEGGEPHSSSSADGVLETLASVPWFVVGVAEAAFAWIRRVDIPFVSRLFGGRRQGGYRQLAVDDDAALLSESFDD
jgi:hypothetical protein